MNKPFGTARCDRRRLLPEKSLPDAAEIIQRGNSLARSVVVGDCAFLSHYKVSSEADYKRAQSAGQNIMVHSQIGYRDPVKTTRAFREIWQKAGEQNARVDRYGICLDWSMGFRQEDRQQAQKGTGLILSSSEQFAELTAQAPVAPHFGDFVLGMPASVENTCAALRAGATSIGNLGQYFTFRLPGWKDDVGDTESTLRAIALIAAQPVDVLIHSNLDDGFAALFTDLACSLGAVLLEKTIVEDLMGGTVSHCYGHSFSEPYKRLVFQLALAKVSKAPGTMVYGNTVMYDGDGVKNFASLASYLSIDAAAQLHRPSGHAINPVPITEATRIPEIEEVVEAAVFAQRVAENASETLAVLNIEQADDAATKLIDAAHKFKRSVLDGLMLGGVNIEDPFELLLSLRRFGAKQLEEDFGPGKEDSNALRGRTPVLQSSTIARLQESAQKQFDSATEIQCNAIEKAKLTICCCTTDVHEYGKILLEETLRRFNVRIIDAGIHADPEKVMCLVRDNEAHAIAISTYNGVALDYAKQLRQVLEENCIRCPVLMGGRTNQILPETVSSLPVDVTDALASEGAIVCRSMDDLIPQLVSLAEK